MPRRLPIVVGILVLSVAAGRAASDQWPRFRGIDAAVAADDPNLPESWSESENIAWKVDIPGLAWSSPVVWDDHIIVTSAISSGSGSQSRKRPLRPGGLSREDAFEVGEPVDGVRHRFPDREDPLGAGIEPGNPAAGPAHQEQLRV